MKNINTDELIQKEHSIAYRVKKEECLDLPDQVFQTRIVQMSKKERAMYDQMKEESIIELENGKTVTAATILTKLLRLQQFTGGFLIRDDGVAPEQISSAKLEALGEIIDDFCDSGKKLIIFARFLAEIQAIKELVNKKCGKDWKWVSIQGSVPKEERGEIIERFQKDPKTLFFVGQLDTCAFGITLTAADTIVYYSKTWNFAVYDQSLSRIHRIGQRNTCNYIDLVCERSIDSIITDALRRKSDLAANIVDTWRSILRGKE